jgi:iron complex outermembrane recepter protein
MLDRINFTQERACKGFWKFLTLMLCLSAMLSPQAQAQTNTGTEFGIEEVVVTARKREESLQETPISIQAFTADGLEKRGIENVSQIGNFTPNMTFDRAAAIGGSNSSAIVYIRGIGQDAAIPTIDLGVGMYVDGVYLARSVGGVLDLVDVERIEVLRGPQGTLFGRNTIGGAINITSKKPNEEFRADATLTFGSDDKIDGKLSVNGQLAENLFATASFVSKNRDGYVHRPDGTDMGDESSLAGRLALRWLPTDDIEVNLAFDAAERDENGAPFTLVDVNPAAAFIGFHNAFLALPAGGCFAPAGATDPACYNEQWLPSDKDTDLGDLPAKDKLDLWGFSANIEWTVNENLILKSVTSRREYDSDFNLDQDHSPITIAHVRSHYSGEQTTQEFQALGNAFDNKLNWILGFYYFQEDGENLENINFSLVDFQSGGSVDNESLAYFAQGTYDFTEKLSITAGIRYTEDTKIFLPDQTVFGSLIGIPAGTPILPSTEAKIKISEVTPMVNVGYQWNDELLTYFSYSEGFKSGGFTQRVFPPQGTIPSFDPEFVAVYEVGFKWQGFNNRMRLNGAYFFSDYEDLQIVTQANTVAPIVLNAGAAEIQGFELDLQAVPAINWLIEAGVGYIDDEITKLDAGTGLSLNNSLVKTPKWSANAALSYTWDWTGMGTLTPRLDFTHRSSYFANAINSAHTRQDAYSLVNLGLTYESNDSKWMVSAYGRNLTDERYISAGYSEHNGPTLSLGTSEVVRDRGREWGITIKRSFF